MYNFTMLLIPTEHFSSALLHSLFNTDDMSIMPSKTAQNIVLRCSTELAIVNVGRAKELPLCFFMNKGIKRHLLKMRRQPW